MLQTLLKASVGCIGIAVVGAGDLQAARVPVTSPSARQAVSSQTPSSPGSSLAPQRRALLDRYCVTCHNEKLKTAGLMLDKMDVEQIGAGAEVWEKVVRKLRGGVMPPANRPRPDKVTIDGFIASLETALDRAAAAAPNPGRPAIHRLNRAEYTNAIRDLLGLEIDGRSLLPGDDSGYGFDNIAEVLTVSPGLLERYLLLAKQISRLAIGDPTMRPTVATYKVPYSFVQDDRMSEDLSFGSRGGAAIRHYFPVDGEYLVKIRLQRQSLEIGHVIRGLDVRNQVDVRLDHARVKLFTLDVRDYGSGGYRDTEDLADAHLEVRIPVKAGMRIVGVSLNKRTWYTEGVGMSRLPPASDAYASGRKSEQNFGKIEAGVDEINIAGPFNATAPQDTLSRRRIFVCRPIGPQDEEPCAKTILSTLARRAYRRPVTDADVRTLLGFYQGGQAEGGFEKGVQRALERILTDPDFLFRVERDPANVAPGAVYRLSGLELASRLSFFLWSSIPDDELLDLAASGKLSDPVVLDQQVRRMLRDARAKALLSNFFGQWLYLRNVVTHKPDPFVFPEFDDGLREAFQRETELFLETQLREDRSATELLTANYTFVNGRLARHYGIPNVYGSRFRRVTLRDDGRSGLLGQGSLLTVTSYANRTSPVLRGKWLLENILGTPPPAPPANVPDLKDDEASQATSMRARMEQHRKNPVCASCHWMIDPLGFALENFDGIGKWRATEAGTSIDASGTLPDGTTFDGPATFREALLEHRETFIRTLTEKLLTYALGRGVEYYDMPAVRTIMREAALSDDRWSSLILEIVKSPPFQMRRSES